MMFLGGLAGAMLDPVNIILAFIFGLTARDRSAAYVRAAIAAVLAAVFYAMVSDELGRTVSALVVIAVGAAALVSTMLVYVAKRAIQTAAQ